MEPTKLYNLEPIVHSQVANYVYMRPDGDYDVYKAITEEEDFFIGVSVDKDVPDPYYAYVYKIGVEGTGVDLKSALDQAAMQALEEAEEGDYDVY